jgi:hypothetical protein
MACNEEWNDITNCAEVVLTLSSVREATIRGYILGKAINATRTPRDLRTAHFLPGDELPQTSEIYARSLTWIAATPERVQRSP